MRVLLFGAGGKVGSVLAPRLAAAGHEVTPAGRGDAPEPEGHDAAVDFTRPDTALDNVRQAVGAGVHAVVGTSGWDVDAARDLRGANVFFAPNFAIGAVLMMRFAAEASRHMAKAEIVELHHDGKLDAPSGTAARTAQMMEGEVPIHSVRLPGLVAHQEVILGDLGQTLTIRHDSIDRQSFMPGVLLAIRGVGSLDRSPVVGLEHLLFDAG